MSRFPFLSSEKLSLEGLQSSLTGLLEKVWHCGLNTGPLDGMDWAPPVELHDEPGRYRVLVELPGIEGSRIDLTARQSMLTVSGDRPRPVPPAGGESSPEAAPRVVWSQRRYGRFHRAIELPGPIRTDAVTAALNSGMLEVTCPKAPGADVTAVHIPVSTPEEPPTAPRIEGM